MEIVKFLPLLAIKKGRTDKQYASVMLPERFVRKYFPAVASSALHPSSFPESRQKSVLFA
jgi:hypothetical protein